ncbi:hypothetical protein OH76DRAFT_196990 [Lentinus brumalis]|uniref:Uncharacterized protein n=1 Tax=Lentinus brumalis TaxID=2498619 RepID=A0A371DI56_9APHY|nr:hypothetical protein OH76DRAFT_196990 [Polyporus brumalis]
MFPGEVLWNVRRQSGTRDTRTYVRSSPRSGSAPRSSLIPAHGILDDMGALPPLVLHERDRSLLRAGAGAHTQQLLPRHRGQGLPPPLRRLPKPVRPPRREDVRDLRGPLRATGRSHIGIRRPDRAGPPGGRCHDGQNGIRTLLRWNRLLPRHGALRLGRRSVLFRKRGGRPSLCQALRY